MVILDHHQGEAKVGTQDRNLKQKPMVEFSFWLDLRFTFSSLSYTVQAHFFRDGTTHSGLGSLMSNSTQRNAPKVCLLNNIMEAIFE